MWQLQFFRTALSDVERLDRTTQARVVNRLQWLADNFDELTPERLKGGLAGLCKFRVGDYRIIYQPLHDEQVLLIHFIGHRREAYKKR